MSPRTILIAVLASWTLGCGACGGGKQPVDPNEPTTAKEKQMREAEAKGEADRTGGKWGGWRYTGDRNECFYVLGRRCFKTEAAACSAARCGKAKCEITGGGPASVSCAK